MIDRSEFFEDIRVPCSLIEEPQRLGAIAIDHGLALIPSDSRGTLEGVVRDITGQNINVDDVIDVLHIIKTSAEQSLQHTTIQPDLMLVHANEATPTSVELKKEELSTTQEGDLDLLKVFLDTAAKHPLLRAYQEVALAKKIELGD